uniref:Carbamoyl phosphate synthase small chain n=1 Tax=Scinaia undulata TaxID=1884664 RepID=A0A1G4NXC5_9FLOR|nr:Carbamoyl phosphate synthase small subunit [Scinaia undulata]SCW23308.1 Carbamoyl phosphate synthase small subunit [Scinaia undulata]
MKASKAILVLADTRVYYGWSFSQPSTSGGEVVFNTGMTGYQEIMTDPSYAGQIVSFTYPELGNTGVNKEDDESRKPHLAGIIAKNICLQANSWRQNQSLIEYLNKHCILHIYGIDTRSLTKHLRQAGTMNGSISTKTLDADVVHKTLELSNNTVNLVSSVTTRQAYRLNELQDYHPSYVNQQDLAHSTRHNLNIIVIDFGTKHNILRNLLTYTTNVTVVPADTPAAEILSLKPDGILLSNGPGDPQIVQNGIRAIKELLSHNIPMFGICMGHQLLSLALGLNSFKLKFGHRGLNHPIGSNKNIKISSQNHGFAINYSRAQKENIVINQLNHNDTTIAAISHRKHPCFAVQYHPEACPGPHDSADLFLHFIKVVQATKQYPHLLCAF